MSVLSRVVGVGRCVVAPWAIDREVVKRLDRGTRRCDGAEATRRRVNNASDGRAAGGEGLGEEAARI